MTLLVDTSVLVYAAGGEHPLRRPALALVAGIADGSIRATTTPEVLQEFLHVHARRHSRREALVTCHDFADLLSPLITVDEATIRRAALEFESRPTIGAFDAVLVALVLEAEDLELVTANGALLALTDVPARDLTASL